MNYDKYDYTPIRQLIKDFVEDKSKKVIDVPFIPFQIYVDVLRDYGGDVDLDKNGFQVDFWAYTTINGEKFMIDGSWWWGDWKLSRVVN